MFNADHYENSRIEGAGILEITEDKKTEFAPLVKTELKGTISGPLAALETEQTFRVPERIDGPIEAVYRFPLPGDAAVRRVAVRFGDAEIVTELKPRREAENEYREAVQEGKQGALMTRVSPDVFTLNIAGIVPGQEVLVTTSFVQMGAPEGPGFSFRVPLTTAPRYGRGDEPLPKRAGTQPLAMSRDPGHRFSMTVRSEGEGSLSSRSFELAEKDGAYTLKKGEVIPDRDLELRWVPEQYQSRPSLQVFTEGKKDPCFLVLVTPSLKASVRRPREVIVLVDHSASMEGAKWEAAEWAVEKTLRSLGPQDRFNLCLFHSTTRWFAPGPVEASKDNVDNAAMFLRDRSSGGTELGVALEQALIQEATPGEVTRQVFIITDAQVTDDERILGLVRWEAGKSERRRCSVLCIDAAPNSRLARRIAQIGGGSCRFLTSSPEEEDITTAMDEILGEWNSPEVGGLDLMSSRSVAILNEECSSDSYYPGRVRYGRSYWLAGRCTDGEGAPRFCIRGADKEVRGKASKGVKALYGALVIDELEMLRGIGISHADVVNWASYLGIPAEELGQRSVYTENEREKVEKDLARLIVLISLKYGVISSETAFVATRDERDQRVGATVMVGNALPAGWSGAFQSPLPSLMMADRPYDDDFLPVCYHARKVDREDLLDCVREALSYDLCKKSGPSSGESRVVCGCQDDSATNDAAEVILVEVAAGEKISDVESVLISRLEVLVPCSTEYDSDAEVQIFIGDMSRPVAKALLRDVIAMDGRPLNLVRTIDQPLKVLLYDPSGSARDLDYQVLLITTNMRG